MFLSLFVRNETIAKTLVTICVQYALCNNYERMKTSGNDFYF